MENADDEAQTNQNDTRLALLAAFRVFTAREGVPEAGCHLRGSEACPRQEGCQGELPSIGTATTGLEPAHTQPTILYATRGKDNHT